MTPTDPLLLVYLLVGALAVVGLGGLLERFYAGRPVPRWFRVLFD